MNAEEDILGKLTLKLNKLRSGARHAKKQKSVSEKISKEKFKKRLDKNMKESKKNFSKKTNMIRTLTHMKQHTKTLHSTSKNQNNSIMQEDQMSSLLSS